MKGNHCLGVDILTVWEHVLRIPSAFLIGVHLPVCILLTDPAFPFSPQGMAFTLKERLQLGIHGLLPPCFLSQDVQVLRVMKNYENKTNDLDKYVKNISFPPSFPFKSWFFKVLWKTWGSCFEALGFPLESLFLHPSVVFNVYSGLSAVNCIPFLSQYSTAIAFLLLAYCWRALALTWWVTLLYVQMPNKKAARAPELSCSMHLSACSLG